MALTIAKRKTRHRADMLFELIHGTAILGPVTGVMHTWGDLVHHKPTIGHEKLDAHDPHIIKRIEDIGREKHRIHTLRGAQAGGHGGRAQDTVAMHVLAGIETGDIAR